MSLDLFTVQTFPNHEQQKDIIENYFDTQSLWIDIKKYCKNNNIPENIVVHGLDGFFEEANQDFREKVRRFNNSILYLTVELLRFANYYKLWQECKEKEYKQHLSIWYRYEARCVCNEIFMYEEKIKNLLRNLFSLDCKKTRRNVDLMNALTQLSNINPYIQKFNHEATEYYNFAAVQFVTNIRNNEIHNESPLDEYTDKVQLSPFSWCITNPHPVIENYKLYIEIKNCLNALLKLKISLQEVIDNFYIK